MFVVNVPKDCVFGFLSQGHEVYAFDYKQDCVSNLKYESVNMILELFQCEYLVYFIIKEEKESK